MVSGEHSVQLSFAWQDLSAAISLESGMCGQSCRCWSKMAHGGLLPHSYGRTLWRWVNETEITPLLLEVFFIMAHGGVKGKIESTVCSPRILEYFVFHVILKPHRINESTETHEWLGRISGLSFDWIGQIYEVKGNTEQVLHLIASKTQKTAFGLLSNTVKSGQNHERTKRFNWDHLKSS